MLTLKVSFALYRKKMNIWLKKNEREQDPDWDKNKALIAKAGQKTEEHFVVTLARWTTTKTINSTIGGQLSTA